MKISYINLMGYDYPLCWSLAATRKLTEKFGSIEKAQEEMSKNSVGAICDILDILIEAGVKFCSVTGTDCPPPLPCSAADLIDLSDVEGISTIFKAMSAGNEREVEVVEKNLKATPGE